MTLPPARCSLSCTSELDPAPPLSPRSSSTLQSIPSTCELTNDTKQIYAPDLRDVCNSHCFFRSPPRRRGGPAGGTDSPGSAAGGSRYDMPPRCHALTAESCRAALHQPLRHHTHPRDLRRGLAGAPAPEDLAVELRKSLTLPKSLQVRSLPLVTTASARRCAPLVLLRAGG